MTIKAYSIEQELAYFEKKNKKPMSIEEAAAALKKQWEETKFPKGSTIWSEEHIKQITQDKPFENIMDNTNP
jgi:hypothetical protein